MRARMSVMVGFLLLALTLAVLGSPQRLFEKSIDLGGLEGHQKAPTRSSGYFDVRTKLLSLTLHALPGQP